MFGIASYLVFSVVHERLRSTELTDAERAYQNALEEDGTEAITAADQGLAETEYIDNIWKHAGSLSTDLRLLAILRWQLLNKRLRCIEQVEFKDRHILRTLECDITFPAQEGMDGGVYIIITSPDRGGILENLSVKSGGGKNLTILNHLDTQAVLAMLCMSEVAQLNRAGNQVEFDSVYSAMARILLPRWESIPSDAAPAQSELLEILVKQFQSKYPIIAVVPVSELVQIGSNLHFKYTCSYTRPLPDPVVSESIGVSRFSDRIRAQLPESRNRFVVDAKRANSSLSYYLRVLAPDRLIVGEGLFMCGERVVTRGSLRGAAADDSWYEAYPARDQPFVHLYTRNFFSANLGDDPRYEVRFYERLPGAIGRAALASVSLVWVILLIGIGAQEDPIRNISIATSALTLQGVVLGWIGVTPRVLLFGRSLMARVSLLSSTLITLIAVLVFYLRLSGSVPVVENPIGRYFLIDDLVWSSLLLIAQVNAGFICSTLYIRYRRSIQALGLYG